MTVADQEKKGSAKLTVKKVESDSKIVIAIDGDFVFDLHKSFREAYRHEPSNYYYEVDLSRCNYMDSASLGMLLVLWEHVEHSKDHLAITNVNTRLKEILSIANFGKHIKIT